MPVPCIVQRAVVNGRILNDDGGSTSAQALIGLNACTMYPAEGSCQLLREISWG